MLPKNIVIFECQDTTGNHGGGDVFMTLVKGTWYFFDPRPESTSHWHKPGPPGVAFIDAAISTGQAFRISEERFGRKTQVEFLEIAADLLGILRQQPLSYIG